MKIIDLLNKIANGEEVPKKIRVDHWCYNFEWNDYVNDYVDEHEEIDLMSALSCDKEELNYKIHELEEPKGIPEKIKIDEKSITVKGTTFFREKDIEIFQKLSMEINEIIDYLKSKGDE